MTISTAPLIAGVRFNKVGKLYHFDASAYPTLKPGDYVVVETTRGRQLGQIIGFISPEQTDLDSLKPIKHPATARDLMMKKLWEAKEVEALITCREAAAQMGGFEGFKFVKARYSYDGSMLTILYTAEEMIDTGNLRKRLTRDLKTRIDLRRIGARDAAKLLGEYGACGAPRCCSTFLTEFSPVSIKMAKAQGISLNPSEITGMCGRLRCCLVYEYEQYVEATRTLPKRNKRVGTPYGEGKVIDLNPLQGTITVLVGEQRYEITQEEIVPLAELRALEEKAKAGCAREGLAGPCECGARIRTGETPKASAEPSVPRAEGPPAAPQPESGESRPQRSGRRRRSRRSRGQRRSD
ncbi:MAG: hypothetical protein Kow00124_12120 [Anaerolineae bacterium]